MSKVMVIPCSGIGKVMGLVAREAALKVTTELCPDEAETLCLAHIVTGDKEVRDKIEGASCISIDGCPKLCAAKNVEMAGGIIKRGFRTVDIFKEHKGAKAGDATALTDEGWQMVDELANKVKDAIKDLLKED
ncbi:MAG: putative zinc-binding protein [Caldanaerobacter sp.]|uniref:putative zinc-binding protein n=1 Tax=Desulfofundulus sp. TaxID=2282750 RepID=UPI003C72FBC0